MAKTRNEHSLEEAKASITEIVSAMSESELEKFLTVLEKWWNFNRGKREHARKDLSVYALFLVDYFSKQRRQQLLTRKLQLHLLYRTMKTLSKLRGKL
jgi:hypothetical protein